MSNNAASLKAFPFGSSEKNFFSDIYCRNDQIASKVKSKLILNDIKYVKPLLILYPDRESFDNIMKYFELEIKGSLERIGGEKAGEIYIPKGYIIDYCHTMHGSSWDDCEIKIEPSELYERYHLQGLEKIDKVNIVFYLTDNKWISPWGIIDKHPTGKVIPKLEPRVVLDFGNSWTAKLEKHFSYMDTTIEEVTGLFSSSNLVLNIEKDNYRLSSINELERMSELIDKLLWYISFCSRQRTTWFKWSAIIGTEFVSYHRSIPKPERINGYGESLIDRKSIKEFLQFCLSYTSNDKNLDLYLPIVYLVNADTQGRTVESQYLALFMSLEALLALYAKNRNKNKHFNDAEIWEDFCNRLKKVIEEFPELKKAIENFPELPKLNEKDIMIGKLGIFNQPSMKILYTDFCKEFGVNNSDLWPIYGTGLALSRIRNKLIHGHRFAYETFLFIAKEHLNWNVERCLLAVLGWDRNSDVDKEALEKYSAYHNWRTHYPKAE